MSSLTTFEKSPVMIANQEEKKTLGKIETELEKTSSITKTARLIGTSGEEIELPEPLFDLLRQLVHHLAQGKAVTIVPVNKELTTQEAADILNISRPFLVKLLEEGKLRYHKVGRHRRIRFDDLMDYKKEFKTRQRNLLSEIIKDSEDAGLYD